MTITNFPLKVAVIVGLLSLASAAQSQPASQEQSLGEVARTEQAAHRQQGKAAAGRVYTDIDTSGNPVVSQDAAEKSPSSGMTKYTNGPTSDNSSTSKGTPQRSVIDPTKGDNPDVITVPAGTEIRVDVVEGKVIVPVRVGFATPIPASSRAGVQVNPVYFYSYYSGNSFYGNGPLTYAENAVLTSVTVRGTTYPVQASTVPLESPGVNRGVIAPSSPHDAAFVLNAPLNITR